MELITHRSCQPGVGDAHELAADRVHRPTRPSPAARVAAGTGKATAAGLPGSLLTLQSTEHDDRAAPGPPAGCPGSSDQLAGRHRRTPFCLPRNGLSISLRPGRTRTESSRYTARTSAMVCSWLHRCRSKRSVNPSRWLWAMPLSSAGRCAAFHGAGRPVTIPHTRPISRSPGSMRRLPRFSRASPMTRLPACWPGHIQQQRVQGHSMSSYSGEAPAQTIPRPGDHEQDFASSPRHQRRKRHSGRDLGRLRRSAKTRGISSALARAKGTAATGDARLAANGSAVMAERASPERTDAWTVVHRLTSTRRRTEHFCAALHSKAAVASARAGTSTWQSPDSGWGRMRIRLSRPSNGTAPDRRGLRCGSAQMAPIGTSHRPDHPASLRECDDVPQVAEATRQGRGGLASPGAAARHRSRQASTRRAGG